MKKEACLICIFLFFLFLIPLITGDSANDEIKKLTHYAEEYEVGNINYVQLMVYSSAVRGKMNEILGAVGKEEGGMLSKEQLKQAFGEPTEITRWVWVEKEEREKRMNEDIPVWRKIIFDGKKIQLWLNAWPSIFSKNQEERLVYRLNINVEFKKPQEHFNIQDKIPEIKNLAEIFNKNPIKENAENLARESVNAEKTFEFFNRQNQGKCEDVMNSIFGSENKRNIQKLIVNEIIFYKGENFDVKMRLEMCDDCEWNWANLDFWLEGRGNFREPKQSQELNLGNLDSLSVEEYKMRIKETLEEVKKLAEQGDLSSAVSLKTKLQQYNEAWNKKANDVWKEVERIFEASKTASEEGRDEYYWIKEEQARKQKEKEIRKRNYEERKRFYLDLFSGYDKKEFYYTQVEYEKRLVEEFKEFGKEICDNNKDDNNNEKSDCSDEQCSGKMCGKQKVEIKEGNETREKIREMFCISGTCQLKEEFKEEKKEVCGNHICEGNETETCIKDCVKCESYEAINCSGKVIFKGKDKNGCPLEPICLEETETCKLSEDCLQPLCGKAECVENKCKVTGLEECRKEECVDGDEKIQNCDDEKIVVEKCVDGIWKKTGVECKISGETTSCEKDCQNKPHPDCVGRLEVSGTYPGCNCNWVCEEKAAGDECKVKEDCGNENDVCSNGKCVTLPQVIKPEIPVEEIKEEVREKKEEITQPVEKAREEQETITGKIIETIRTITGKVTGLIITGFQTEETQQQTQTAESAAPTTTQEKKEEITQPGQEQPVTQQPEQTIQPSTPTTEQQEQGREEEHREEERKRESERKDEEERRENEREECDRRCGEECDRNLIAPCTRTCVSEKNCGDNCDRAIEECKESCKKEKEFDGCVSGCKEKCMKGEKVEQERKEEEHKEEKGVFKIGGSCRVSQQKTESFIYFDGWGEPFDEIRFLKSKYYSGGQADWCKQDFENLIKQRRELESSFNEEFVKWFFEKYLANSAEDWEQHVSGIFELYWKDVELSREIAFRMGCLEKNELPEYKLINVKYETDFGKIEFWEEVKTARIPGLDKETQVISPYMKIWIFPPKEFIEYEMKTSMKKHEFPGKPEDKLERNQEEGMTEEEKEMIKKDKNFIGKIKKLSEKYGGNIDVVIQFKDYDKSDGGEVIFNLYAKINPEEIIKIEPMLPEENPKEDIKIEIDFERIYEIIYDMEKEMRGEYLESPPWDRKFSPVGKIKEITNGIKVYFKIRGIINDAKIYPEDAEDDMRAMLKEFFSMMMKKGVGGGENPEDAEKVKKENKKTGEGKEKGVFESKEKITGEVTG